MTTASLADRALDQGQGILRLAPAWVPRAFCVPGESYIALLDSPEAIRRKFRRAVTDSEAEIRFDLDNKPGVSNLLNILSAVSATSVETICSEMQGQGYGVLKERTAEAVIEHIRPIRAEFDQLIKDKVYLSETLKHNAGRAQAIAQRTLRKVYKKVGLYQP